MNVLPILERELRAESRNRHTYALRVLSAAVLVLSVGLLWLSRDIRLGMGDEVFSVMHQVLFWGIWLVVPVMAADCLSREKREGTLGLLFLSSLRADEIVLAKGCVHGLRAATLLLAAVPVLMLPFLVGGIGWAKVLASTLILASALCCALGAALLASSTCRALTHSIVLAAFYSCLLFVASGCVLEIGTSVLLQSSLSWSWVNSGRAPNVYYNWGIPNPGPFSLFLNFGRTMDALLMVGATLPGFVRGWLIIAAGATICSVVLLRVLMALASRNLRRTWQQQPRLPLQTETQRRLFQPRYGLSLFRRWMHRLLERNPIGWLERRTWQGRVISWTWLAVVISLTSAALSNPGDYRRYFQEWPSLLGVLLGLSLALSAAGSFRRERESGVMELLLVAPLRVEQIVAGRLRGLWGQFLPAVLLLLGLWLYLLSLQATALQADPKQIADGCRHILFFGSVTMTVPVIGLYFSLRCRLLILAVVGTVAVGIALPRVVGEMLVNMSVRSGGVPSWMNWTLVSLSVAAATGLRVAGLRSEYRRLAFAGVLGWLLLFLFVPPLLFRAPEQYSSGMPRAAVTYAEAAWRIAVFVNFSQMGVAGALGMLLHRNLVRRRFSLPQ